MATCGAPKPPAPTCCPPRPPCPPAPACPSPAPSCLPATPAPTAPTVAPTAVVSKCVPCGLQALKPMPAVIPPNMSPFPTGYGYVVLTAIGSVMLLTWKAIRVGQARAEHKVPCMSLSEFNFFWLLLTTTKECGAF